MAYQIETFKKYDTLLDTAKVRLAAFAIPNGLTESISDITHLPIYEKVGYKKVELVRSKIYESSVLDF